MQSHRRHPQRTVGLLLAICAFGVVAPAMAQTAPDPFKQAMAARQVAEFGRRNRDPQALLTAARMLQEVPMTEGAAGKADSAAPADGAPPAFSPKALLTEAKILAKGNPALLSQIAVAASADPRGVRISPFGSGLVRVVLDLGARQTFHFPLEARMGEPLNLGVIGDPKTKLLLRMRDAQGRLVCEDDNNDYAPVCAVTPRRQGALQIQVVNNSDAATRAVILSN